MRKDPISLDKGGYKVIEILCISKPLLSLKAGTEHTEGMHKALVQNESGYKVVYFIDPIDFGAGSKIFLKENTSSILLRNTNYIVTFKKNYRTNTALIGKLLLRNDGTAQGVKP
ncbi:uncharacterized protein Eint_051510 [Encephalitozoon intestinalis ATCC 50506]|uniref:Uncharacterized protein n=1 Tax=Encephalitozoon intestinalis (strain ATCC 50506) TaxID=876142 RepID=E0S712_ENCIT|nr:uncharacterized protein Eint_051510 [Encephalitozoon intestinalis ATCC 50506]ADM11598.1 hypothetical protein Eint_051510 [Encephalitozoon intestinalis ATCC 50506]UTX45316.1 hypothetical protein GPK93_05g08630 [Encephalitozoon intestinalis]